MRSGGCAGSGRALRLDPFGLPVRFSASDAAADGRMREVELHRERVVLRRSLHGMRMALNMPVASYNAGVTSISDTPARRGAGRMARVGPAARRALAAGGSKRRRAAGTHGTCAH